MDFKKYLQMVAEAESQQDVVDDMASYGAEDLDEGKFKDMSIVSVNGKNVDVTTLGVDGVDHKDSPDFSDAYISYGEFVDGTPLSDDDMDQLGKENPELVNHLAHTLHESKKTTGKKSLKDWFEQIDKEMIAEAVPTGMKPMAILDPTNKEAGVGVLSSPNPTIQKMLGGLDPKDVKIVMTKSAGATSTTGSQPGLSTGGGATTVKEEDVMEKAPPGMEDMVLKLKKQYPGHPEKAFATAWSIYNKKHGKNESTTLDEKWAGDAEVKATGQYSGKTVEELKSMLAKLKKSGPHELGSPANKRMKQIMFAIRAKKGWKGGVEEAFGAGSTFSRSSSRLDRSKSLPATSPDSDNERRGGEITIPQKDREEIARILGTSEKVKEASSPMDAARRAEQRLINLYTKAKKGEKVSAQSIMNARKAVIMTNKNSEIPSYIEDILVKEAEIPHAGPDYGAGLGAGRSATTLESQKVTEAMNTLEAAYHEGKSHGLTKHSYACRYDEGTDEHRRYHEGFKEGLDECYGLMPNQGLVDEAEMEEGNAFTAALAKTPKGGKFTVGGKTFTDTSSYDSQLDEFAFESLDKKLNALLNEDVVTEGLSVNMSQGLGGPTGQGEDTVSVTATGDDSAKLLDFIKQVGLGGLGGSDVQASDSGSEPALAVVSSDYGAPKFSGHDGMKDLMAKITGGDFEQEGGEDEEHSHGEETCETCGMIEGCGCHESTNETETPDQETDEMAEDAAADAEEAMTTADEDAEAKEDETKPASGGATNEDASSEASSDAADSVEAADDAEEAEEALNEWANEAGKDGTEASFERDIEFMTKVISGGLNKPKSTGQTTIPVIAGQDARTGDEDVAAWKKLAGLGK